jgi:5'-nucleotidase
MRIWPTLSRALSGGLFTWAAATLTLGGTPACQLQTANAGETACPPNADGSPGQCQVELTLLHTADIHSRLLPYDLLITQVDGNLGLGTIGDTVNVGGAARMGYILKRERAKSNRVLHISGGDVFEGAPIFNFFSGEPEMRVQAELGVDAMVIANHEFDRGAVNVARQIQKWADFPVLAANYVFSDPTLPTSNDLDGVIHPFTVLNAGGLKVAVIGMGNLSSLTSIFNTPNSFGIKPLNSDEVVQFYVDLLRPLADVIVVDSHLGLEVDQRVITETSGVDVWLGSHNHIVINPPEVISDCSADPQNPGFIWVMDPTIVVDESKPPPSGSSTRVIDTTSDPTSDTIREDATPYQLDPANHPYEIHELCKPRPVVLAHSGAFAKYVGRLDLVLSNNPADIIASRTGDPADYNPRDGFELLSNKYQVFPITADVPEDPVVKQMLEPYQLQLQQLSDLTTIAGFSPNGAKRSAPANGDSPLGNLIAAANWLRLGIQTDFALTNTTGIRQDLLPGPVTIDEAYDIFPFDNTITTMYLSGAEVFQMYDFVARRSGSRGCVSQAQIAGSRVRINCAGCTRTYALDECMQDSDCPPVDTLGTCDLSRTLADGEHPCAYQACAENIYIGSQPDIACQADSDCTTTDGTVTPGVCQNNICVCESDNDCPGPTDPNSGKPTAQPNACAKQPNGQAGICMTPVLLTNDYELSTSNYLAGGGSGFRVLQRNTTQINSGINQRDAMLDFIRQGKPCGWQDPAKTNAGTNPGQVDPTDGLTHCANDNDCATVSTGGFVCACAGASTVNGTGDTLTCGSGTCDPGVGRCIPSACRDQVAEYRARRCAGAPDSSAADCQAAVSPCDASSQICQIVSCVDDSLDAVTDNRIVMVGQ